MPDILAEMEKLSPTSLRRDKENYFLELYAILKLSWERRILY